MRVNVLGSIKYMISIGNHTHLSIIWTSNSGVITRGEAECNFDCYAYKSQIVRKMHAIAC